MVCVQCLECSQRVCWNIFSLLCEMLEETNLKDLRELVAEGINVSCLELSKNFLHYLPSSTSLDGTKVVSIFGVVFNQLSYFWLEVPSKLWAENQVMFDLHEHVLHFDYLCLHAFPCPLKVVEWRCHFHAILLEVAFDWLAHFSLSTSSAISLGLLCCCLS